MADIDLIIKIPDHSWIINDDFFGIAIRIGRETQIEGVNAVYHITAQVGYGQLTIGFTS